MAVLFCALPVTEVRAMSIASIVYDFSSVKIPEGKKTRFEVDPAAMSTMYVKNPDGSFATDNAGHFVPDQAAVGNFINALAAMYDIPGQTVMNKAVEVYYLSALISTGGTDLNHVPSVAVSNIPLAASDSSVTNDPAGKTYIDINITTQTLIYYVNGTPTLISEIVTGNPSRKHDTPVGVYSIYNKQLGRTLRGADYEAYVNYWMPFTGNYGIHDATWRKSFGGNIYVSNGSHGCVNMPKDTAAALYAAAPVGTMVLVHL